LGSGAGIVDIRKPTWWLRALCPVCSQGCCLALVSCPHCNHVVVVCEEEGSVFLDPRTLAPANRASDEILCPQCARHRLSDFAPAMDQTIEAFGLTAADYE
jgi:hypothetical protein